MIRLPLKFFGAIVAALVLSGAAFAQDVSDPLGAQGLESLAPVSVRTRAMGGAGVALAGDEGAMYANPALLEGVDALRMSFGGRWTTVQFEQAQRWNPNRFYADLSLMFENKFEGIKEPDSPGSGAEMLHKPFDSVTPNWDNRLDAGKPGSFTAAIPLPRIGGMKAVAALGWAEMANLNHYYQNNNAISPNLGQYRPAPIPVVANGDTLPVEWYQFIRRREGSVYGIIPAVSITPVEGITAGVSFAVLNGSFDDYQERNDRGRLRLLYNTYFLDSVNNHVVTAGTSNLRGTVTTLGLVYRQERFAVAVSAKPPVSVRREWSATAVTRNASGTSSSVSSGVDTIEYPWLYTIGIALHPTQRWSISIDYAVKSLQDLTFTPSGGSSSHPWVNGSEFRAGAEFQARNWLLVRAGARQDMKAFAPAGEGIIGEAAEGAVYSAGFGVQAGRFTLNGAYEFSTLKYNDLWQSNVNTNRVNSHTVAFELGYKFE